MRILFKRKAAALFPLIVLLLTSCSGKTDYQFLNSESNIVSIEIGYVEEINTENVITQDFITINTLTNDQFTIILEELRKIECFMYFTDPKTLKNGSNGIKITYNNGDFEIIGADGQAKYKDGYYRTDGYYYFDDDMFQELIDNWSNNL